MLIETFLLGLLLTIPLIWLIGMLADLHRVALASASAAREAGFEAARSNDPIDAGRAVQQATSQAFVDQGLDPSLIESRWSGDPGLRRGTPIEVSVRYPVTILQAPLIGRVMGPSVWVEARHVARVDPYGSRE